MKPTVFSHVKNGMTIAREEIFGPVLAIIGYEDDADAVASRTTRCMDSRATYSRPTWNVRAMWLGRFAQETCM